MWFPRLITHLLNYSQSVFLQSWTFIFVQITRFFSFFHMNSFSRTCYKTEAKDNSQMAYSISPRTSLNHLFPLFVNKIKIKKTKVIVKIICDFIKYVQTKHNTFRCCGLVARLVSPVHLLLFDLWCWWQQQKYKRYRIQLVEDKKANLLIKLATTPEKMFHI